MKSSSIKDIGNLNETLNEEFDMKCISDGKRTLAMNIMKNEK